MAERVVRGLVVLALLVDAGVHLALASDMQLAAPGGIGGGWLFRIQAVLALLAAGNLALRPSRLAYLVAGAVALSAFVPALLYTYADVPAIGPVPAMHDPFWSAPKMISALAEGLGAAGAMVGIGLTSRPVRDAPPG
ncbi:hypothetical protein [Ornithinimicrobium ciconiae]|uniref:hypothetical protein n=1 Tax=Ornithinimicrobium ciconiae TaxID=2594265 RepID=UPI001D185E1A|nr:hypothetical protein [Ornithinimicrobium ciconiae]